MGNDAFDQLVAQQIVFIVRNTPELAANVQTKGVKWASLQAKAILQKKMGVCADLMHLALAQQDLRDGPRVQKTS